MPLAALAFAFVHLGDLRPVGATFAAGLVWSSLYVRWPNVWALGISHGLLAPLAYYLMLGHDVATRV